MWPFKRKKETDPVEGLADKINELEGQLKKAFDRFEDHVKRLEEEKKALATELRAKTTLIENLFSQMLTNSYQNNKKDEKEDSNLVDISKLSDTMRTMVKTKLAEANKNTNGAKKQP